VIGARPSILRFPKSIPKGLNALSPAKAGFVILRGRDLWGGVPMHRDLPRAILFHAFSVKARALPQRGSDKTRPPSRSGYCPDQISHPLPQVVLTSRSMRTRTHALPTPGRYRSRY
jgi:hypothetical protein